MGSECVGMSGGWEERAEWATTLAAAEWHTRMPLRTWMKEGPESRLSAQRHAPNAILAHSVGVYRSHLAAGLAQAAAASGHSLGFFSAIVAAGVVPLEAPMDLVQNCEDLADAAFGKGEMGMAFLIGLTEPEVRQAIGAWPGVVLSNINGKANFSLSGECRDLQALVEELAPRCLKAGMLPVQQPLHGSHMAPLLPELRKRLKSIRPQEPRFPLICMQDGRRITSGAEAWAEAIASVALPVDWPTVVRALGEFEGEWCECGFGTQLTRLTRWLDRDRLVRSLQKPPTD
jgi:[acyl-carrier-protein] S-malonyltransferase